MWKSITTEKESILLLTTAYLLMRFNGLREILSGQAQEDPSQASRTRGYREI